MGLIWDKVESQTFQLQVSTTLTVGEYALDTWKTQIDAAVARIGVDLTSEAATAVQSLLQERLLPLVESARNACTWTRQHLETYATAEAQLIQEGDHFEEDALQSMVDVLHAQAFALKTMDWILNALTFHKYSKSMAAQMTAKFELQAEAVQKQLDTLRIFSSTVSSLFDEERDLCGVLYNGLLSISAATLSGGVYTPASVDSETWLTDIDGYLRSHGASADPAATAAAMKQKLIDEGLLAEDKPDDWHDDWPGQWYDGWLENAAENNVPIDEIVKIVRELHLSPYDFQFLDNLDSQNDPDGKTFFLIPPGTSPETTMNIVLLTYIYNAGTDYGTADDPSNQQHDSTTTPNDYAETPYSLEEIERIRNREQDNSWSYIYTYGAGAVMATPNGMLMGVGGISIIQLASQKGGTTYGDLLLLNLDATQDPRQTLKNIVANGSVPVDSDPTGQTPGNRDLDRLLHHEERHSQQWATSGFQNFVKLYALSPDTWEEDAGLYDGGYR